MKLKVDNLTKTFGTHKVIQPLDLDINCKTLALIGPSGSGKSTLLKLLAGLEIPETGSIEIDGQKIQYDEAHILKYRRSIGVVFQSWNLFPHLTALENIVLPLYRVQQIPKNEAERIGLNLLERFDLDLHAEKKPNQLSGGQVQRIALIRAIATSPKLLFMDEPTSALDPLMTSEVLELISEFKDEGKDLIIVTHHLPFARRMADYVLFMDKGILVEHGSPEELFDRPKTPDVKKYMEKVHAYES